MKKKLLLLFLMVTAVFACALGLSACGGNKDPGPNPDPGPGPTTHTHSFINYVSNNDASCTSDGTKTAKCEGCEVTDTKPDAGSKLPHTEVDDDAVPATCTEEGLTAGKHCSVCSTVIVQQTTVPASGHTEVDDDAVPATCTEAGLTAGKHCSVCSAVTVQQTTVPASGHTEVDDDAVPATCTEDGLTAGKHCSVCSAVTVQQTTVPASGHTEVDDDAVPATCTEAGLTAGKHCSVCWTVLESPTTVPATGHSFVNYISDGNATCTKDGTKTATCEYDGCDETDQTEEAKLGHNFVDGSCSRCSVLQPTEGLTYYSYYGEQYQLTGIGTAKETEIIIASDIDGIPVTIISYGAFINCQSVTAITIPDSITVVSEQAFKDSSITKIYYTGSIADWCKISGLENIMASGRSLYIDGTEITGELVIPEEITEIADYAFQFCEGLTGVTIPDGVTSIGEYAFRTCTSLTDVTISDSVTSIGKYAFYWCLDLKSIKIPEGVTSIGINAFNCCNGLTVSCEVAEKPVGWADDWNYTYYLHDYYYGGELPVVWNCNNNETTSDGYTYKYIDGLHYQLKDETATVYMQPTTLTGSINIPATVTYDEITYNVTGISDYAFGACEELTEVIIADGVASIGNRAFYGCSSLTSVTIPESVTSIKKYAFANCAALTAYCEVTESPEGWVTDWIVYAPVIWDCNNNDKDKNGYAYAVIDGLHYSLKDGAATVIGQPKNIVTADIPKKVTYKGGEYSVTSIGASAFENCVNLTSVTMPYGVISINSNAFKDCSKLTSITIPDSVKSIAGNAFENTAYVNDVNNWEDGALYIGNYLIKFVNSSSDEYEIKQGTLGIAQSAFERFKANISLIIPDSVTSIDDYAFSYCSGLTSVAIPDSVTSIGDSAFQYCSSLTSVTIPDSVISIGEYAFYYCSNLTSITLSAKLTSIDRYAFQYCSSLTSITIPESVTEVGYYAFINCTVIKIYCEAEKKPEGWNNNWLGVGGTNTPVIWDCKNNDKDGNGYAYAEIDGINYSLKDGDASVLIQPKDIVTAVIPSSVNYKGSVYSVTSIGNYAYQECSNLISITIPDSVTSIGWNAFENCTGLTSITIPDSVTVIKAGAFYGCSGLTSIIIPESVTLIEGSAFKYCSQLTSITLPDNVILWNDVFDNSGYYKDENNWENEALYLGNQLIKVKSTVSGAYEIKQGTVSVAGYAFEECSKLTDVTIPDSVKNIGCSAFSRCSGLTSITIPDSVIFIDTWVFNKCTGLTSVTIGNGLKAISDNMFIDCSELTSVTIGNSVTSIGENAFYNCTSLTSVVIPESVTSIYNEAFDRCTSLTSVYIPESVTYIGWNVFRNCSSSLVIYCEAEEAPSGWDVFWNSGHDVVWDYKNA